jgi:2-polyprenyl-6-methoxyphenol hydroxylase-like FAD-dependent oxidoreductase
MRILVVGGGIGGLSAAIALRQSGFDVRVFERATRFGEAGTALTLWSNALRAARRLGVAEAIERAGTKIETADIRACGGRVLVRTPVGELSRELGAPSACVPRPALQSALLGALTPDAVRMNAPCVALRDEGGRVVVRFADGTDAQGDVLVGADGLKSSVRDALFGTQPPRYAGYTSWRAIVEFAHGALEPGRALESWGRGARFGLVPLDGGRVYWFAKLNAAAGGTDVDRATLEARFRGWHEPIAELIAATPDESILRHDIYDRDPLPRWGAGRITLLGDAAHPTTPDLAQGACMAMEDAVVLARELKAGGDPASALRRYETLRMPRTSWLTREARRQAWYGQLEGALVTAVRDLGLRLMSGRRVRRLFRSYVDYEA